jgi:hypothetical protein
MVKFPVKPPPRSNGSCTGIVTIIGKENKNLNSIQNNFATDTYFYCQARKVQSLLELLLGMDTTKSLKAINGWLIILHVKGKSMYVQLLLNVIIVNPGIKP